METTGRQSAPEGALIKSKEEQCDIVAQKRVNDGRTTPEPVSFSGFLKALTWNMHVYAGGDDDTTETATSDDGLHQLLLDNGFQLHSAVLST